MNIFGKVVKSWLLLASFVADSVVMVHVDWSDVFEDSKIINTKMSKTLRVIRYDVEEQQILSLNYYDKSKKMDVRIEEGSIKVKDDQIICARAVSGTVIIWRDASDRGNFPLSDSQIYNWIDKRTTDEKNNMDFSQLKQYRKKPNIDCEASVYDKEGNELESVKIVGKEAFAEDKSKNDIEQGILGELLTDLTFYSRDYKKLDSKLTTKKGKETDHGLDGVYVPQWEELDIKKWRKQDKQWSHIFCTESKFRSRAVSPKDFEAKYGMDGQAAMQARIKDYETDKPQLHTMLQKYYTDKKMSVVCQTMLGDGRMSSPYTYWWDDLDNENEYDLDYNLSLLDEIIAKKDAMNDAQKDSIKTKLKEMLKELK